MSGFYIQKPDKWYNDAMKASVTEKVRRRILKAGTDSLFLVADFLDLGSRDTITRILSRLVADGLLNRVHHGVYHYPRISKLLNQPVPPTPGRVAEAIARRNGQEVAPTKAQAASGLGVTTQVPAKPVYQVNGGRRRRIQVGNQIIELRPAARRNFITNTPETIIQALRFVGEGNITDAMIEEMRKKLTPREKSVLRQKLAIAPAWMHVALREIARKEEKTK